MSCNQWLVSLLSPLVVVGGFAASACSQQTPKAPSSSKGKAPGATQPLPDEAQQENTQKSPTPAAAAPEEGEKTSAAAEESVGVKVEAAVPQPNGIGEVPVVILPNSGSSAAQCNQQGKVWVPQLASPSDIKGECRESLAAFTCVPANIQKYFNDIGQTAYYDKFVAEHAGYVPYNCGLADPYLQVHWIKSQGVVVAYAAMVGEWRPELAK
jgi:hypothetical protein